MNRQISANDIILTQAYQTLNYFQLKTNCTEVHNCVPFCLVWRSPVIYAPASTLEWPFDKKMSLGTPGGGAATLRPTLTNCSSVGVRTRNYHVAARKADTSIITPGRTISQTARAQCPLVHHRGWTQWGAPVRVGAPRAVEGSRRTPAPPAPLPPRPNRAQSDTELGHDIRHSAAAAERGGDGLLPAAPRRATRHVLISVCRGRVRVAITHVEQPLVHRRPALAPWQPAGARTRPRNASYGLVRTRKSYVRSRSGRC